MKSANQQECMAASLYSSVKRISHNLSQVELPRGFTPERFRTLTTIYMHGPISVTRVAALEQLRPATVSRMIASLESAGFIRRRDASDDKRSVLLSTTAKGRRMYERSSERYLSYLNEAIMALDPDQVELIGELVSLLDRLSVALEK
ncbi:MAG TPA: MarR family transcriptional regulator [Gammaproteobacteria bacterium]|nr:MarR family transcriptional regulator [Gammaproteobacteria bacterium]